MSEENNPYEYCDGRLGVKISFLTTDKNPHPDSIKAIKYNTLWNRAKSKTRREDQIRRSCIGFDGLIDYNTIEQSWKDELTKKFGPAPEKARHSYFSKHYTLDLKAHDFYALHRYGDNEEYKLDKALQEQYTINASVLNAVLEIKAKRKAYKRALGSTKMDIWESLTRDVESFRKEVPHTIPSKSLRRVATKYKNQKYIALISGKLQNKNASKTSLEEQQELLDGLLRKHQNLDNEIICTMYNEIAERVNWPAITAGTVANRKPKSKLSTHAGRNGISDLRNKVLMQNKRSAPSAPMYYWTMDGWDVELLYQDTVKNKDGHSVTTYHNRLTYVVILDPYNKYPVGYAIGTHETPDLIIQALQNAQNHVKELFGAHIRPHQLQSDNYQIKKLKPYYERCANVFTPAAVKNSKSKVIEPWFNYVNKKYYRMFDNWSGYNTDSGSKNQPNTDYLDKIKKNFPDAKGCIKQIDSVIAAIRKKLQSEYVKAYNDKANQELLSTMSDELFLQVLGNTTGHTNKLEPGGVLPRIMGERMCYDSFDLNFRKLHNVDWTIKYNPEDLSQVLAVSPEGKHQYMLTEKYVQPMALADQQEGDSAKLKEVRDFNKAAEDYVLDRVQRGSRVLENFFNDNPVLDDTLGKHLLTNSMGQHKDVKSGERLKVNQNAQRATARIERKAEKVNQDSWSQQQDEYLDSKIDVTKFLSDD